MIKIDWKRPNYKPVWQERVQRLKNLREKPELVPGVKVFYATHPVEFIQDWLCTFDPRNVERDLPAVVPFLLFAKQAEFITWLYDRWRSREDGVAEKSRDMGVSWLCVGFAVWMWLFHPGTVVGFGSRKESMVDEIGNPASLFWKLREAIRLLPVDLLPAGYDAKKHAPYMRILNPETGSSVIGEAGANIGRGARASIYFVDEAAFLEQPESIDAALSQTANCKIHVSTPNGEGNPFAKKRKSGKYPVFTFRWTDDPRKDQEWYDAQVAKLDPVVVAQEIDISYSASVTNAYVPGAFVSAAMAKGPADVPRRGPVRMGVDVARFGNDSSVITIRDDRAVFVQDQRSKIDLMSLCGVIKDTVLSWPGKPIEQIAIDVIGIGAGVVDRLLEMDELKHVQIIGVNSSIMLDDGRNYNTRARIWRDMKDWLDPMNGPVSLPMSRDLEMDLTALHYGYRNSKLLIESKDDAKKRGIKSPDCFVAGTMVLTPAGEVPIDSLRAGDFVCTPMGNRVVVATWESTTYNLTTATLSNGRTLTGKGAHKVFTWDSGFIRLDSLALTNELESAAPLRRFLWSIVNSLSIAAKSSGFKQLVDISSPGVRMRRSDFFTGAFGLLPTEKFRRASRSITAMVTGATTPLKTLNSWMVQSIALTTWQNDLRTTPIASATRISLMLPAIKRLSGMEAPKVLHGTLRTAETHGQSASQLSASAPFAQSHTTASFQTGLDSALMRANRKRAISVQRLRSVNARFVALVLRLTNFVSSNVAPVIVQTRNVRPTLVYNLTLDKDNVYYANGVLVANCADSLALTFAEPVRPRRAPEIDFVQTYVAHDAEMGL